MSGQFHAFTTLPMRERSPLLIEFEAAEMFQMQTKVSLSFHPNQIQSL
jgi:hypothetical protein